MFTAAHHQQNPDGSIATVSGNEPAVAQATRARSHSASTSSSTQSADGAVEASLSSAAVNTKIASVGMEEERASPTEGGGGLWSVGKEDVAVDVGVGLDVEAETEKIKMGDLVAAEAEKPLGGAAVDRVRSPSSVYRLEEGTQSHHKQQQLPRSRAARTVAHQEKAEVEIEGGTEVPPELVVSEDQEVCGLGGEATGRVCGGQCHSRERYHSL